MARQAEERRRREMYERLTGMAIGTAASALSMGAAGGSTPPGDAEGDVTTDPGYSTGGGYGGGY